MRDFSAFEGRHAALCALAASTIALASACDTDKPAPRDDVIVEGQAGQLHVDEGGAGGLPVVFVHAFGGNTTHFAEQLAHLRGSREAIAIDLRGHGRSTAPGDDDYRVESLASDIEAAVDALVLERFVLIGHSMGGSAALAYTEANPGARRGAVAGRHSGQDGACDGGAGARLTADRLRGGHDPVHAESADRCDTRSRGAHSG